MTQKQKHEDGQPQSEKVCLTLQLIGVQKVCSVACGWDHTVLATASGEVWCAGDNSFGQCGYRSNIAQEPSHSMRKLENIQACSVFAGFRHTAVLDRQGSVWLWGDNSRQQCGPAAMHVQDEKSTDPLAEFTKRRLRQRISRVAAPCKLAIAPSLCGCDAQASTTISFVALGCRHSLLLTQCGHIISFGGNEWGQCGRGSLSRAEVPGAVLSPSPYASAPPPADVSSSTPSASATAGSQSEYLSSVTQLCSGWHFGAAVVQGGGSCEGGVYTWGQGNMGQLGRHCAPHDSGKVSDATPAIVSKLPGGAHVSISAGSNHVLAVAAAGGASGAVYSWGWNEHGNLGLGHTEDVSEPQQVPGIDTATAVSAGGATSFVKVSSA